MLEKILESPSDCKVIKPVSLKGNQPWIFIERMMLNLQYFGHLMQKANSLEKTLMLGKIECRRRGWQRTSCLESITNSVAMSFSKLWEMVKDREAWDAAVHGVTKSWSQLSDWTTMKLFILPIMNLDVSLEKAMAPHSSTLAWKIPRMEEPGRLQSRGSRRVRRDWVTELNALIWGSHKIWETWQTSLTRYELNYPKMPLIFNVF